MEQLKNRITGQELRDPKAIKANSRNWRKHPPHQLQALEASMREVGWVQQVIVNETTGNLVDGHARVEIALKRKETAIPVLLVKLTEAEERLVLATFDPITDLAIADAAMLQGLLAELRPKEDALQALLVDLEQRYPILDAITPQEPVVPIVPDVKPQTGERVNSDVLIEIRCAATDLSDFSETLEEWGIRPTVTIAVV